VNLRQGDTRLIIDTCKAHRLLRNQCAYVLATSWHETGARMVPVREMGGEAYLKARPYYPYVGMGYVQLTWLENYKKARAKLGVDFVANPRLLLVPRNAARILVAGMAEGWFTGKKLSDYLTLRHSDFTGARRIVNGADKANLIAGYARTYDRLLREEGYGGGKVPPKPQPAPTRPAGGFWASVGAFFRSLVSGGQR
jgi:predicted chitinase